MAETKNLNKLFSLLFLTFSLFSTTMADKNLTLRDLNSAIFTLRSNGYNLFANAIAVSDLSFQILTVTSNNSSSTNGGNINTGRHGYTLLAPPNSALFSLDMSTDAFTYVHSLRFHVIPRRLTFSDLRKVSRSDEPYVETLAGGHVIAVVSAGDVISVDGVVIAFPDMHLQSKIVVHGLDGILTSSAARIDELGFVTSPQPFAGAFSPENVEVPSPDVTLSPEIGAPSPVTTFGSFTIGSGFGSVSVPPAGFYSSELGETPMSTPSIPPEFGIPSPECSEWSNCASAYNDEGKEKENDENEKDDFGKYNHDYNLPPPHNWW